ncbi:MAG TPA: lytic transglycosylase domain-containing protein [Thermoanaerobaculia bacterium]
MLLEVRVVILAIVSSAVLQLVLFAVGVLAGQSAIATPRIPVEVKRVAETRPVRLVFPPPPEVAQVQTSRPAAGSYGALIHDAARRHDVPENLIEAVIRVESDFDTRALSSKGARGLMQVMPDTGRRFGVADPDHLFDPSRNLSAGTAYLAWLLKRYRGDLDLALAAYNAGEGAVAMYGGIPPYRETREYVRRVRKVLSRNAA